MSGYELFERPSY